MRGGAVVLKWTGFGVSFKEGGLEDFKENLNNQLLKLPIKNGRFTTRFPPPSLFLAFLGTKLEFGIFKYCHF